MKALPLSINELWPMLKFFKSRSKVTVKATCCLWYCWKGLVIRNTHAKYEYLISYDRKVMANVKVFQKKVKGHLQGHIFKIYGIIRKALSWGTCMPNMKAIPLRTKELWPMLKVFFKSRSKVTVKVTCSKFIVPSERSCHKEYSCQILKPYLLR